MAKKKKKVLSDGTYVCIFTFLFWGGVVGYFSHHTFQNNWKTSIFWAFITGGVAFLGMFELNCPTISSEDGETSLG